MTLASRSTSSGRGSGRTGRGIGGEYEPVPPAVDCGESGASGDGEFLSLIDDDDEFLFYPKKKLRGVIKPTRQIGVVETELAGGYELLSTDVEVMTRNTCRRRQPTVDARRKLGVELMESKKAPRLPVQAIRRGLVGPPEEEVNLLLRGSRKPAGNDARLAWCLTLVRYRHHKGALASLIRRGVPAWLRSPSP